MATTLMEQCADDLKSLMQAVVERIEAGRRGEPVPQFEGEQMTGLLLCVGGALLANHRALKPS